MVYSPLTQAALFLVQTAFGLYAAVVLLRLLFQAMDVDFRNPLSQFVYKATQPLVAPLRRALPWRLRIEPALVVLLLAIQLLEVYALSAIRGYVPGLVGALLMAIAQALALATLTLSAVLIVRAIASWVVAAGGATTRCCACWMNSPSRCWRRCAVSSHPPAALTGRC